MSQLVESVSGQFDRLPPHSIEAEMCLLASMMLDKEMIGEVVQLVDREGFFQADHQIIFDVLVRLYEHNRPIDAVIVREELLKRHLLEEIGGVQYLAAILNSVPSAAHGKHYAGIVREKSLLRQLIAASDDILARAMRRTSRRISFSTRRRRRSSTSPRRKWADRWWRWRRCCTRFSR